MDDCSRSLRGERELKPLKSPEPATNSPVAPYAEADGKMLLHRLDLKEICIPTGSACDSVNTQVSHVIKAIKVPDEYAEGTIRITFGIDNREDEAPRVSKTIATVLGKGGLRNVL